MGDSVLTVAEQIVEESIRGKHRTRKMSIARRQTLACWPVSRISLGRGSNAPCPLGITYEHHFHLFLFTHVLILIFQRSGDVARPATLYLPRASDHRQKHLHYRHRAVHNLLRVDRDSLHHAPACPYRISAPSDGKLLLWRILGFDCLDTVRNRAVWSAVVRSIACEGTRDQFLALRVLCFSGCRVPVPRHLRRRATASVRSDAGLDSASIFVLDSRAACRDAAVRSAKGFRASHLDWGSLFPRPRVDGRIYHVYDLLHPTGK